MSQNEKTDGQVLFEAMNPLFVGDYAEGDESYSRYGAGAAAVIAHHEAGKADEVATLRVRVADLEAQLAERRVVVPELTAGDMIEARFELTPKRPAELRGQEDRG